MEARKMIIEEAKNGYVVKSFSSDSEFVLVHHKLQSVVNRVVEFFGTVTQEIVDVDE